MAIGQSVGMSRALRPGACRSLWRSSVRRRELQRHKARADGLTANRCATGSSRIRRQRAPPSSAVASLPRRPVAKGRQRALSPAGVRRSSGTRSASTRSFLSPHTTRQCQEPRASLTGFRDSKCPDRLPFSGLRDFTTLLYHPACDSVHRPHVPSTSTTRCRI